MPIYSRHAPPLVRHYEKKRQNTVNTADTDSGHGDNIIGVQFSYEKLKKIGNFTKSVSFKIRFYGNVSEM